MKLVIEKIPDLTALYVNEMRLLLSAEEMIAPKSLSLFETAVDDELKAILNRHWQESERQAGRLRELIARVTSETSPIKCKTVYSLFEEAEDMMQGATQETVRDLALVAVALRIKCYELSFHETVQRIAAALGRGEDAGLLGESLREETVIVQQLTNVADRLSTVLQAVA